MSDENEKQDASVSSPTPAKPNPRGMSDPPGLPVDRGWAWAVLFGAWLCCFLVVGFYKAFGIIFIELQLKYGSSSSVTSLVTSLLNAAYSITSLVVMTVGLQFMSIRTSAIIGSTLTCVAMTIASFASNIESHILSLGLLVGVGHGLILLPTISLLGRYFKKRQGFANCFATSGGSAGSLVFPFLLRGLLDAYSLGGTLLLLGAVMLQGAISGALMTPPEFYRAVRKTDDCVSPDDVMKTVENGTGTMRSDKQALNGCNTVGTLEDESKTPVRKDINTNYIRTAFSQPRNGTCVLNHTEALREQDGIGKSLTPLLARHVAHERRIRTVSEKSGSSIPDRLFGSMTGIGRYASVELPVSSLLDLSSHDSTDDRNQSNTEPSCRSKLGRFIDCSILRRAPLLVFIPSGAAILVGCSVFMTFLPPHANDLGFSQWHINVFIAIIGSVDFCALLLWGLMADRKWLERYQMMTLAAFVLGIMYQFVPLVTSYWSLVLVCVIYGLLGRVYISLFPVVLLDFLGIENLRSALAVMGLVHASSLSAFLPVVGAMRDVYGAYSPSFHLLGAIMIAGGCGMMCLPLGKKWEDSRMNRRK